MYGLIVSEVVGKGTFKERVRLEEQFQTYLKEPLNLKGKRVRVTKRDTERDIAKGLQFYLELSFLTSVIVRTGVIIHSFRAIILNKVII